MESFFGFESESSGSSFLDGLPPHTGSDAFSGFSQNVEYPVIHYNEQLYLEHALIVATHTVWKFMVTEERNAFARVIQVEVKGNFEPFNEPHTVSIEVEHCQSAEEYEQRSKARRTTNDVPTWKAYHLPPVIGHDSTKQNSTYCVVLSKPQKWGSQMMPVRFYFRGQYSNSTSHWERVSSPAIMLTNSASKWYEKAFITLSLHGLGYDPKVISKPDAMVRWEDFLTVADLHVAGSTGSRRKLSDNISFLTRFHLESIASMVQCDDGRVTLKRMRNFCNESSDGIPPLKHIESLINRYRQSWESGAIVGVIRSGVVKQYLTEQNQPVGNFVLRIQYNNPSEICASSVQINPQTGITFVDHLTISQHVAPDDSKLQEYLACSPIHKVMMPMQVVCSRPVTSTSLEPSQTYRTTDQELQRTNQLLQQAYQEGFQGNGSPGTPINRDLASPCPSPISHATPQSPGIHSPAMGYNPELINQLDEQVLGWLRYIFQNDSEQVFQEVAHKFVISRVTANSLHMLDSEDLKEMEIPLGPRKLLLRALSHLNSQYPR